MSPPVEALACNRLPSGYRVRDLSKHARRPAHLRDMLGRRPQPRPQAAQQSVPATDQRTLTACPLRGVGRERLLVLAYPVAEAPDDRGELLVQAPALLDGGEDTHGGCGLGE